MTQLRSSILVYILSYFKWKEIDSAKYYVTIEKQHNYSTNISINVRDSSCSQELGNAYLKLSNSKQEWVSFMTNSDGSEDIRLGNESNYTQLSVLLMGTEPLILNIEPYRSKRISVLVCLQAEQPFVEFRKTEGLEIVKNNDTTIEIKSQGEEKYSFKKLK